MASLKKPTSLGLVSISDMNNLKKTVIILMASLVVLFADVAPTPPIIPEVQAVSSNEEIILMWDNKAESSIDPLTGYSDFEGYRIYRSSDGGQTWGKSWNRIYDFSGNHVAWKPYAQFDLIEESDSLHCVYSNGYLGESSELCYSNAIPYNSLPDRLYDKDDVIVDSVDVDDPSTWLVKLPNYVRGSCPIGQEHISHSSSFTHETDCYGGGNITSFDPMASWISLGDNDSLKRSFVDTDVLDGVQYTYVVTAFDIGMVSFKVEFLNTDNNAESDENYCNGDDSHCSGMECCGDGGCCLNDNGQAVYDEGGGFIYNKINCEEFHFIWLPDSYVDEATCDVAEYTWQPINHGYEDYSTKQNCEDFNHEWVVVEYYDEETCEQVDLDGDGLSDHQWKIIYFKPDTTWSSWNPGHYVGLEYGDDLWGYPSFESPKLYESFTDYNVNGICDDEPFMDEDSSDTNNNGICDEVGDWSSRCPDNANACKNTVVVESGYKASNVTYPADTPEIDFIEADTNKKTTNKGNGSRVYNIVNEYDLTDAVLRFEINAGLDPESFGDSTGSFATLNPSLYIYEIISKSNMNPKDTIDIFIENIDSVSLLTLLDLPGANDYSENGFVSIPEYKVENFKLTYIDDPLYANHFTDWFDGIQFRFDNGPNKINDALSLVEIKDIIYSDTLMESMFSIKMKYNAASDMPKRPMYRYRVDLSTSVLDTATYGQGRKCDQYDGYPENSHTLLPFKITNITNDTPVVLSHSDDGIQSGGQDYNEFDGGCTEACTPSQICVEGKCQYKEGDDDCRWQRNEVLQLTDIVYSDENIEGVEDILFDLKIDFDFISYALSYIPNLFQSLADDSFSWYPGFTYDPLDVIYYDGMLYRAKEAVSDDIPPSYWYDNDSDNINDNIWEMLYPWNDEDYIIIEPYGWYQDGDAWVADLSIIGELDDNEDDDLENVSVVPNPYIVSSDYFNESPGNHLMRFTRLPTECTISIYTVSGEFVTRLDHNDPFSGNEWWNITNGRGQALAPGLYIYVVETPGGESKIGKFAIVR